MNKAILIGRLTRDPEIRTTSTGKKVASFSIAVNDGRDASGKDITHYFDCSAWEKVGEIVEKYVKKGTQVAVVGNLRTRSWDKPDGTKGKAVDINVRELDILTSRAEAQAMASTTPNSNTASNTSSNSAPAHTAGSAPAESNNTPGFDPNSVPEIDVNDIEVEMPF